MRGESPQLLTFGISDEQAFSVGLPCGGEIDVFVQEYDAELFERIGERRAVVYTDLELGRAAPRLRRRRRADGFTASRAPLAGHRRNVFADVFGPPPRLLVFGAIDTAEALCAAAKRLGWRTIAADARGRFATRERMPSADELIVAWPEEVLERVQPDHATAVVVLDARREVRPARR